MLDYIRNFAWNGYLGILLYWAPLLFCVVFYTARTAEGFMTDKKNLDIYRADKAKENGSSYRSLAYYNPRETVGGVLGRALVSIVPVANLWAALFDLSPKVFGRFFEWLAKVFDQPLVPK